LAETDPRPRRSDRSAWNWLLVLPIVVPLLTFVYNSDKPRLGGIPFFYWAQFLFVALGVICTTIVYRVTRTGSGPTTPKED
jgi:hypothetical protein